MGGATAERGGRSKRFYELTRNGKVALTEAKSLRDELWLQAESKPLFTQVMDKPPKLSPVGYLIGIAVVRTLMTCVATWKRCSIATLERWVLGAHGGFIGSKSPHSCSPMPSEKGNVAKKIIYSLKLIVCLWLPTILK